MCCKLNLYLGSIITFPLEVVSVPYTELSSAIPSSVIEKKESFAVYYNHFMNVNNIASQMRVVGITSGDETGGDIWLQGERLLVIKNTHKYDDTPYYGCDACYVYDVALDDAPREDIDDILSYSKTYIRHSPLLSPLSRRITLLELLRIIRLTDVEKFYALGLPSMQLMYAYGINTLRLKMAYYRQEGSIVYPFFLN